MRKLICCLIIIFGINKSYSKTCKTISKLNEYRTSDLIILAEIVNVTNSEAVVEIFENFKGSSKNSSITIMADNLPSLKLSVGQQWLFYLKKNNSSRWVVNICGWSRSFSDPLRTNPPPPPSGDMNPSQLELMLTNYMTKGALELINDLQFLRNKKHQQSSSSCDKEDLRSNIIIGLLSCSLLVLILIFCKNLVRI